MLMDVSLQRIEGSSARSRRCGTEAVYRQDQKGGQMAGTGKEVEAGSGGVKGSLGPAFEVGSHEAAQSADRIDQGNAACRRATSKVS